MIYLASPYSSPDFRIQEERYLAARNYVDRAISLGECVFSPIVYAHRMAHELGLATSAEAWWEFNRQMLYASRYMTVLTLDGWGTSKGVQQEIAYCELMSIPIFYAEPSGGYIGNVPPAQGARILGAHRA